MPPRRPPSRNARTGSVAELAVGGVALKKMDTFSRSDPFIVLYTASAAPANTPANPPSRISAVAPDDPSWAYHGETETLWDVLSPRFAARFLLPLPAAAGARLRFEVFDADTADTSAPLSAHDFIGAHTTTLSALLAAPPSAHVLADRRGRLRPRLGSITLAADSHALPPAPRPLSLRVSLPPAAAPPPHHDLFYTLTRAAGSRRPASHAAAHAVVHRSGRCRARAPGDPAQWQEALLTVPALAAGDPARELRLELYCWRAGGRHVLCAVSGPFSVAALRTGSAAALAFDPAPAAAGHDGLADGLVAAGTAAVSASFVPEQRSAGVGVGNTITGGVGTAVPDARARHMLVVSIAALTWAPQRDAAKLRAAAAR